MNDGAFEAGIAIASPVPGFLPVRASRLRVANVPNPAIRTDSSLAWDSPIASNTVSTAASASALPSFSLTANRRADQAGDDAGAGACRDADADRAHELHRVEAQHRADQRGADRMKRGPQPGSRGRGDERLLLRPVGPDGRGGRGARAAGAGADPGVRAQPERMEEVPAGRETQQGAGGVACGVRFERTVGVRAQGGAQRALPLRLGPEIQELLRCALTGGSATTERMRRGAAGRRSRREFVVVGVWNRAMCHPGMAERHSITVGSDEMNKTEMTDRLAARTGLSKGAARDVVDGVFAIIGERNSLILRNKQFYCIIP